jgi:hypothetical protein
MTESKTGPDIKTNSRALEDNIHTDFKNQMSYGDYLHLDQLLTAQKPQSDKHDEMLFIIIHQSSELWLKLASHELSKALGCIKENALADIIVVAGNPLQDISLLSKPEQNISMIMRDGKIVKNQL